MDTMSASFWRGMKAARSDVAIATITVLVTGVIVRGFTVANRDGSKPVASHRIQDAGLAVQGDQCDA